MHRENTRNKLPAILLVFLLGSGHLLAQREAGDPAVSGFQDSRHHWMDITDHEQVIVPADNQKSYQRGNVREIADNILLYQQPNGGWPKNYDMLAVLSIDQKKALAGHRDRDRTTFDNGATHTQIEYLARAYELLKDPRYRDAALRGIRYILAAQYPNGGWPQFYPDRSGYRKYITFNDGAMTGVMTVLQHIVQDVPRYSFVDDTLRKRVAGAYRRGLDCILHCQIVEHGILTAWCQQHDNVTLEPVGARAFELPAEASAESVGIVELLMQIDHPDQRVMRSIDAAVAWFKKVAIHGIRIQRIPSTHVVYKYHMADDDVVVVPDSAAPPVWTRYYELETDRPMFANRDGKKVYSLAEVTRERRTGYGWYGFWPAQIINSAYPRWRQKNHLN